MEEIRQNGKIILHSDDGTSIRMIFKNLTGRIFKVRNMWSISGISQSGRWDFRPAS